MIKITRADEHYTNKNEWLATTHHFSFGDYIDPNKMNFGPLRVFNDDVIQPSTGFDFHHHRDMEIITYVIDGQLQHKDNQGNHGIVNSGEIQVMTAGSGIMHSEYNPSPEKPLRLLQIWVFANKKGLLPAWQQRVFTRQERLNKLLPVVGSDGSTEDSLLRIHQDVKIYISSLESSKEIKYGLEEQRKLYLFVISGNIKINGDTLQERDAARIEKEERIYIKAENPSELILIDLPEKYPINQ